MPNRSERQVDGLDLCSFFLISVIPLTKHPIVSQWIDRSPPATSLSSHNHPLCGFSFINRPFCALNIETDGRCSLSRSSVIVLLAAFSQWRDITLRRSNTNRLPYWSLNLSTFSMAGSKGGAQKFHLRRAWFWLEVLSTFSVNWVVFFDTQNKSLTPTVTLWITHVMPFFAIFMQVLNVYRTALYSSSTDSSSTDIGTPTISIVSSSISGLSPSPLCHVCRVENKIIAANMKNLVFLTIDLYCEIRKW